jgi:hypothetical protein
MAAIFLKWVSERAGQVHRWLLVSGVLGWLHRQQVPETREGEPELWRVKSWGCLLISSLRVGRVCVIILEKKELRLRAPFLRARVRTVRSVPVEG